MRAQQIGPERAIKPDGQRLHVPDRRPKSFDRMTRQIASGHVGNRHRNHYWHITATGCDRFLRCHRRTFGVQRIENRFDQQKIDFANDQSVALLAVNAFQIIEIDFTVTRIVDIGRERKRFIGRPDRSGDKPAFAVPCLRRLATISRQFGRLHVDLAHQMFATIIGHADLRRAERVGLDHIRACIEIGRMNGADDVGPGDRQQIIIALLVFRQLQRAAIIGLLQFIVLDSGPVTAVEDQDLLRCARRKRFPCADHAACSLTAIAGRLPSKWQMA